MTRSDLVLALFGLPLLACAPQRVNTAAQARPESEAEGPKTGAVRPQSDGSGSASIDSSALTLQASQETIYVWGGLYTDAALEAPVPLTKGVVGPGDALDVVRVHCLVRGPKEQASVKCRAAGGKESPQVSESWHARAQACTEVHERSPTRKEIAGIEAAWKSIVQGPDFQTKGMAWSVVRYNPPALAGKPTLLEVVVTHEWQGPERVGGGCDKVPPGQGCDPYIVETGRTITLSRDAVRYGYSEAPDVELQQLFGGRAPLLHRIRIGVGNAQGYIEEHPSLKIEGSSKGIEDYRHRQLAALDAFVAAGDHRPDVVAAIHINKAIAALHLKDLELLRSETSALRQLVADTETDVDREGLMVDNALAYFDRVLAKEWLLEDPCPR